MNTKYLIIIAALFGATSCNKYLDAVPDKSLTVPTTLQDMTALLDNDIIAIYSNPALGEIGSDDYYLEYTTYQSRTPLIARNAYTWQTDVFQGNTVIDWDFPYRAVYYSNVVLDNLGSIRVNTVNQTTFNIAKGRALFYRAFAFYNLAQLFAKPYIPKTAATDLGIPLRLDADLNTKSVRSTVRQTYDQIIKDLLEAKDLLPSQVSTNTPNIPSRAAAFAMLARVYLNMQDYNNALAFADSALNLNSTLMDFNAVDTKQTLSFPYPANPEVLYQAYEALYFYFTGPRTIVDSTLYDSYDHNDLRRAVFFATRAATGTKYFKASYTGTYDLFCGLATDEMYLIQSECYAREGDVAEAMKALNAPLTKRWRMGTYLPFTASTPSEALDIILKERRKELIFRGLRWSDLRRLNQDPQYAITLTRVLNGQIYTLPPNDPRYVYPIHEDEIKLSGIQQNAR